MKLRSITGLVVRVSEEKGEQLLKTGLWRRDTPPAPVPSPKKRASRKVAVEES